MSLTIEQRLTAVEAEVAQLKENMRHMNGAPPSTGVLAGIGKIGCLEGFPDPEGWAEAMKQARDELNQVANDTPSEA